MPVYDYRCSECKHEFDVTKPISSIDDVECCPSCLASCDHSTRIIKTSKEFFGEKPEEPFFSVALGKMVSGNKDLRRQAKERGLIEVGNENVEKMIDRSDRERERRSQEKWSDYINPRYELRR